MENFEGIYEGEEVQTEINTILDRYNELTEGEASFENQVYTIQKSPTVIFMTVMIQDTAEQKVILPTFYTMRLVGNELFAIYMNYPQGYGFDYDFAEKLTEIALSLKEE